MNNGKRVQATSAAATAAVAARPGPKTLNDGTGAYYRMNISLITTDQNLPRPRRREQLRCGIDLAAPEDLLIYPGHVNKFNLAVKVDIPPTCMGLLTLRSSTMARYPLYSCG